MRKCTRTTALVLTLLAATSALAQGEPHGNVAQQQCESLVSGVDLEKIDTERAKMPCFLSAAGNPDPEAHFLFGRVLEAAHQDKLAVDEYNTAAQKGHVKAQYNLGFLYYRRGNYPPAIAWFRKAAEQGYAPAQNGMGVAYNAGNGVEYDDEKAMYWFRKAASQGDPEAQANLADLEQFYRTHSGGNDELARTKQQIDQDRRLRCGTYQMTGNRMGMAATPGCY